MIYLNVPELIKYVLTVYVIITQTHPLPPSTIRPPPSKPPPTLPPKPLPPNSVVYLHVYEFTTVIIFFKKKLYISIN